MQHGAVDEPRFELDALDVLGANGDDADVLDGNGDAENGMMEARDREPTDVMADSRWTTAEGSTDLNLQLHALGSRADSEGSYSGGDSRRNSAGGRGLGYSSSGLVRSALSRSAHRRATRPGAHTSQDRRRQFAAWRASPEAAALHAPA